MALYDDLMAAVAADPNAYSNAVNQLTQAAGGFGMADPRQIANLAAAAQGKQNYYSDTSSPLSHITGLDASGAPVMSAGISGDAAANPYYQPGGAGYAGEMAAFAPTLSAMQQAANNAVNSAPPQITQNPDGSATASFASGATHTVTDPNALAILQKAYPGYGSPSPIPTPPVGGTPPGGGTLTPPPSPGGATGAASSSFGSQFQPGGNLAPLGGLAGQFFGGKVPGIRQQTDATALPADVSSPMPGASYSSGTGFAPGGYSFTSNPAYSAMADDIARRSQLAFNDMNNQIRSNAIGTGGLGGTRQGVAQGVAMSRLGDALQGNLGNLAGGLYENQQNRDLSRYGIDTGFYTSQRGQDLAQTQLGADLFAKGVQGPWNALNSAGTIFDTTAGLNTTGMQTGQQGGGWGGAVGGALGTYALGNRAGLWGNTPTNTSGGTDWSWTGLPKGVM